MSMEVTRWTDQLVALIIALIVIGVVFAVGVLVQEQISAVPVVLPNGTTVTPHVPSGVSLSGYGNYISTLILMIIIAVIIGVIFGFIIPYIKGAGTAVVAPAR